MPRLARSRGALRLLVSAFVLCAAGLWLGPPASAAPIYARLDVGAAGQRAEGTQTPEADDDWTTVGTAANNVNATPLAETQLTSLTGDIFTVSIDNLDTSGS